MSYSIAATTRRLFAPRHELSFSWWVWLKLLRGLRERGRGVHESGAFLLGKREAGCPAHVHDFVLYDDLDTNSLSTGIVRFDGRYYGELWQICGARGLDVVADVHTHPGGEWQSGSDRDHPMIAQAGHLSLIIPNFARAPVSPRHVGMNRYLGNRTWQTIPNGARSSFLFLGPW